MKKVAQIHISKIYQQFCTCHVCHSALAAVGSDLDDTGWICNEKQKLQGIKFNHSDTINP